MIAELVPTFDKLTLEQKWRLVQEMERQILAEEGDVTMQEPLKSEIVAELERRHQHYLAHPETALTLDELTAKIRARKK